MSASIFGPDAFPIWAGIILALIFAGLCVAKWYLDQPRSVEQREFDEYCSRVDEDLDELERARRSRKVRGALDGIGQEMDRNVFTLRPPDPVPFTPRTRLREFDPDPTRGKAA